MTGSTSGNNSPEKIAHIGIAVKSLATSITFYTNILGLKLEKIEEVHSENVKVAFLRIGETLIELLEPTSNTSAIHTFIEKRGEGIHHIAFEVSDIHKRLQSMKLNGIQLINEQPKKGANDSDIAFIHPKATNGVLMELCQTNKGSDL